jgi:hypothetical protein
MIKPAFSPLFQDGIPLHADGMGYHAGCRPCRQQEMGRRPKRLGALLTSIERERVYETNNDLPMNIPAMPLKPGTAYTAGPAYKAMD